jgi:hypothetical protein
MDLLKKAFEVDESEGNADLRGKFQELWGGSLNAVRESASHMAQTNVRMMELWTGILKKNMNGGTSTSGKDAPH